VLAQAIRAHGHAAHVVHEPGADHQEHVTEEKRDDREHRGEMPQPRELAAAEQHRERMRDGVDAGR
jgi:hypothetical protein